MDFSNFGELNEFLEMPTQQLRNEERRYQVNICNKSGSLSKSLCKEL